MPKKVFVKDEVLARKVEQQLMKRGIRPPCRVTVSVMKGIVTLKGQLQYEVQRKTALRAVREVPGVQRVVSELHVRPTTSAWKKS